MTFFVVSLAILLLGGAASLLAAGRPKIAIAIGSGSAAVGCAAGLVATILTMVQGGQAWSLAWNSDWGCSLAFSVDALSGLFLMAILGLSLLASLYGASYVQSWAGKKNLGASWFFFNLLVASMVIVCLAANGLLFLIAWEVMSLASYFLVVFLDEREEVRRAGWTYLVATHIGTAFLLVLFVLLSGGGSFDFDRFFEIGRAGGPLASAAFLLAVAGFGTKAGFVPLHVWLPEAHPVAPSHVSAVMSGVMIKTGIYGLLRAVTFLGTPPTWWGQVLVGVGLVSGILGVLLALAQHDLKRLLAYHSVENIGIIAMGIGMGLIGWSLHQPVVAALGLAGALLHVINHAMFKGLLFLGAGAVGHAAGTLEIEHLGGLAKKMPQTAFTFVIGAAAITGLPPLNGFISEFAVYFGSFQSVIQGDLSSMLPALLVIGGLAMIGGLAAACFTKAYGVVFLGEARSEHVSHAHEVTWLMRLPMWLLAGGCLAIGLLGPLMVGAMAPAVSQITGLALSDTQAALASARLPMWCVTGGAVGFLVLAGLLALVRRQLLKGREVTQQGTWDCGYVRPTARMQYTASSYADPILKLFRALLHPQGHVDRPHGLFPQQGSVETHTPDMFHRHLYRRAFAAVDWLMSRLRWLQHGRIQLYVLYIALTVLILLAWKLS